MNEWVDADEVASAAAFDMATDLPKLYASCWSMAASQQQRLKAWTMFLYAISIMGRASDVTTYCADVIPTSRPASASPRASTSGMPMACPPTLRWRTSTGSGDGRRTSARNTG